MVTEALLKGAQYLILASVLLVLYVILRRYRARVMMPRRYRAKKKGN